MAKNNNFFNALNALGLVSLVLFMQRGEAATFTVGGSKGWSVPSDNSPAFNQWAEKMRFQIGDSLLFVYAPASDSVLQVTKEKYDNCDTNSPTAKFTDGHTEFKLKNSGPYYFISGNKDNCNKNEKLVVVVLADRIGKNSPPSPPPSPSPSPSTTTTTTTSTSTSAPSPAPTTTSDQQPPAASPPSDEGSTPAPSAESNPPKNGAASFIMSFVGSLGAFVGSSLFLVF